MSESLEKRWLWQLGFSNRVKRTAPLQQAGTNKCLPIKKNKGPVCQSDSRELYSDLTPTMFLSLPCSHITSSDTTPTSSKTPKGGSTLSYSVISIMQGGCIVWLSALPSFSLLSCHLSQFLFHLCSSPNHSLFLDDRRSPKKEPGLGKILNRLCFNL